MILKTIVSMYIYIYVYIERYMLIMIQCEHDDNN